MAATTSLISTEPKPKQKPKYQQQQEQEQNYEELLKQQQEFTSKGQPSFFVLRKRSACNRYDTIALYSEQNYFLGVAYFKELSECLSYKARYEQKLMRRYLHENTKRKVLRKYNSKFQTLRSAGDIRVFCEPSIPKF